MFAMLLPECSQIKISLLDTTDQKEKSPDEIIHQGFLIKLIFRTNSVSNYFLITTGLVNKASSAYTLMKYTPSAR